MDCGPRRAERIARALPFLAWRAGFTREGLVQDLLAGLTVGLVLVPQALAYAQLAGMPPQFGLYAAILPVAIGALFGSSPHLSTGPVALTSLLAAAALTPLAAPGSSDFIALMALLTLLAGLIQLAIGALRGGALFNLLSHPVLSGFVNAAALIICIAQLPLLAGLPGHAGAPLATLRALLAGAQPPHLPSLGVGLGALAALYLIKRFAPRLPAILLVVVLATTWSALSGFAAQGGAVVGAIATGLPTLTLPDIDAQALVGLLPAAAVVALVSFMEAAASCRVSAARTRRPWDDNQELIGQGLAKLASAVFGGLPVSGSFSRSALLLAAGARSGVASLFSAAVVLACLVWATPLLVHLPLAVLAAIILQAVLGLIDPRVFVQSWQASRDDGLAGVLSFVATLAFAPAIHNGILAGLLVSLGLHIYRSMQPRVALLGLHPDGSYRDAERFGLPQVDPTLSILRFDGPLHFVNAARFENAALCAASARPELRVLLISAAGINAIDASGIETLRGLIAQLAAEGRTLAFCGLKQQVIEPLQRTGLWPAIAAMAEWRSEAEAVRALLKPPAKSFDLGDVPK